MKFIYLILGNIWMVPNTIFSALYLGVFAALGWIRFVKSTGWALCFESVQNTWLSRRGMAGWAGWSSGVFIVVRYDILLRPGNRTVPHEERHVKQQMVFGIFHPIFYILMSCFIWAFLWKFHSYYDNLFERDARKAAGQKVNIPKENWRSGPEDRWIWW